MNAAHLSMALAWCALAALASGVTARAASPESARCYCMQRGGSVLETGDPFVHICCYPAKQRCLAVDERSQLSSRVDFPDAHGARLANGVGIETGHAGQ